jgi:hypothetical protein
MISKNSVFYMNEYYTNTQIYTILTHHHLIMTVTLLHSMCSYSVQAFLLDFSLESNRRPSRSSCFHWHELMKSVYFCKIIRVVRFGGIGVNKEQRRPYIFFDWMNEWINDLSYYVNINSCLISLLLYNDIMIRVRILVAL